MSGAQHTKGPWIAKFKGDAVVEDAFVASCSPCDAALIAAAPDLLAASEAALSLLRNMRSSEVEQDVIDALIDAVAKARGGA